MGKNEIELCDEVELHEESLSIARAEMPPEKSLSAIAELFRVFGDLTRVRILYVLYETELCVCDIAAALSMTPSAVSHQLRILKQSRLIRARREGKSVFYALADDHVHTILGQGMEHIRE